ncbi:ABC transporter substrate-binding protein [Phaeovulum vinaykumarii]|uniref:Peptide/nickel transport system substrate-binding protein n=1 Tax=Phaeovulum vinaykumarii TaxID=407234 RepID=A0A1N7JM21_9RHOB|nr:ABC transporter substrate-binding protein [Phaeovulum vinaykumarii]SIS50296.1 peptide/nickel transport system substrate-binding protein [Phaeovulum vinaykumarii]SOB90201.1 peptide/nickel transport system substrate-binding protein [Phaeovulum vinaykumarii]
MLHSRLLASAALGAFLLGATPAATWAETPPDTLIQAWSIDDIISLDPAEIFEFTASEITGNSYETLIGYDPADVSDIFGKVAESWTVSEDGKTISFKIREGRQFASGNPITAEDAVFSLVRAVKLDKSPAFILTQFGLNADNVEDMVVQTGPYSFDFKMDKAYAPSLVLYCLTATVAMVVDKKLVMEHAQNGDYGYEWLKTNYAGSGPFTIRDWRANEVIVMERNENYSGEKPAMARAIYRHIPETATQRLLLERGDIDIARNLAAEDIAALEGNPDVKIEKGVKGSIYYLGLNQKNPYLSSPQVRQAMKWLVDYDTIANTIMAGKVEVHQAFLPKGFLGALNDTPFSLNVEKARELLAEAGYPDGFTVTMDTRNTPEITAMGQAIQQTMAMAGITLELIPGDGQQTLTKYRARNHDIYIGRWGPDYQDPHTNADTFARNPDNSDDAASKPLAWRNAWEIPEMTARTDAAVLEADPAKRAEMYLALQRESQETSPFVIMFQEIEVSGMRQNVDGFIIGPSFNDNSFAHLTK